MKKMLEETFLTIEQMGYGIIDPVLAHWEVPAEVKQKKMDLSDPIIHGKHSPVLFDDVWLQEYEIYAGELLAHARQNKDWNELFKEIEEAVKTEGIWADKDATLSPEQIELEQAIEHREEVVPCMSSDDIFSEFEGWPARTIDILSTSDQLPAKETESVVVELPLRIYSQQNRLVLQAELPGLINSAAEKNADLRTLLTQLATGTDNYKIKTSVVHGELQLELLRR